MHIPCDSHWMAATRVLCYLKGIVDYKLFYALSAINLNDFCDSNWAENVDDRKSTNGLIHHFSRKKFKLMVCQETKSYFALKSRG